LKIRKGTKLLIPENVHPDNTIYYNGAFVLNTINKYQKLSLLDLYVYTQKERKMSMPLFILCLDWLFLLNIILINDQGTIELCS